MNKKHCSHCLVDIADELRYCPLCGKYVAENKDILPAKEGTYPKVDQSYTIIEKWIKQVRAIMFLLGILSVAINLFFKTEPYWFPYVLVGLFALWRILFYPFKEGKSHISSIPMSGIVVAILLIFLDVYNYCFNGSSLGWALCYAVPAVLTGTTALAFVLALSNRKFEDVLARGMVGIAITNIIFFISKLLWFDQFRNWPIFMSLLASFTFLFLLFMFKRKRLVKEFNRNFHI